MNNNVVIEFFDSEPLENLITCLNYEMDKVVYIGYPQTMTEKKRQDTSESLTSLCGMSQDNIEYIEVNDNSLSVILEIIEQVIVREADNKNQCFIDITGGEDLVLVALGQASVLFKAPMHRYDVINNELNVLNPELEIKITDKAVPRRINVDIENLIRVYGARINYNHQSCKRTVDDRDKYIDMINKLWEVSTDITYKWNSMCGVLNRMLKLYSQDKMNISVSMKDFNKTYSSILNDDRNQLYWNKFINAVKKAGCISTYSANNKYFKLSFSSEIARNLLTDPGLVLELHTYFGLMEKGEYDECLTGVHIDWDGEIHQDITGNPGDDVENEIDVIARKGNIMTFISCKNGEFKKEALYELDAVVSHFGEKYIHKCIVATQPLKHADIMRAQEMGIVICNKTDVIL